MLDFFLGLGLCYDKFHNSLSQFDGCSAVWFTVYLGVYRVHGIKVDALIRVSPLNFIRLALFVGF
jgi:hypothetical protein